MATVVQAKEFLDSFAAFIDDQITDASRGTMTFALVVWVKGQEDNLGSVSLLAHPDHAKAAPAAMRTAIDAYELGL